MLMMIDSSSGNTRGPVYTESLLRTLHTANRKRLPVTFVIAATSVGSGLAIQCPRELRTLLLQELQDAYPGTNVRPEEGIELPESARLYVTKTCDGLPLTTFDAFTDETDRRQLADPTLGLLSALRTTADHRVPCRLELQVRPAAMRRVRHAEWLHRMQQRLPTPMMRLCFIRLLRSDRLVVRTVGRLFGLLALKRDGSHCTELPSEALFECELVLTASSEASAAQIAGKRLEEVGATLGRFNNTDVQLVLRRNRPRRAFLLSAKEVASIWHPLTASGDAVSRMRRNMFREVEPPLGLTSKKGSGGETILGRLQFRQQQNQFGITMDDLRRHMIAVGKTGCGKSTFLLNVVRQQIENNRGVILFDPHGQLAQEVLDIVPKRRTNDVVCFDASERVALVGFNPMVGPPGTDPTLIADGVLTAFKNVFGFDDGSAPRLLTEFGMQIFC